MRQWNQIKKGASYGCIEYNGQTYYAMLIVTNGASWAVAPDTETEHSTFEEAVKELGLNTEDFEEAS